MTDKITPFDPSIPKDEVDRLFRKLADTRLPEIPVVPDAGEDYGSHILSYTPAATYQSGPYQPNSDMS